MSELKKAIEMLGEIRKEVNTLFYESQKALALTQALYIDLDENDNQYGFCSGEALLDIAEEKIVSMGCRAVEMEDLIKNAIEKLSEICVNEDNPPVKGKAH